MKMNKMILGLAVAFASGSMLKGMELSDLKDAVNSGDIEKVKELAGEVSDKTALNDLIVVTLDSGEKSEKMIEALLAEGAEPNRSTLSHALESSSLDSIAEVVENMTVSELNEENAEGQTAAQEIEAEVSTVVGALAKKGAKLTPGMQKRMEQGKKIREARQERKASPSRQRTMRTTSAGKGRATSKVAKPAAHARPRRMSN